MRHAKLANPEFGGMSTLDVFVNDRPSRLREPRIRVPVDDRRHRERMAVPFTQTDHADTYHHTAQPPSTQMFCPVM